MPHAYTEAQLVEQLAGGLSAALGLTTVSVLEEIWMLRRTRVVRPLRLPPRQVALSSPTGLS